jgi:hypothetical protein
MKIPLTIIFVFLCLGLFSQENTKLYEKNKFYGHIINRQCSDDYIDYGFTDSLKQGYFSYFSVFDSTIARIRGSFKFYKRDSTWYFYWPNGSLREIKNYRNGVLEGSFKNYNLKGELLYYGNYKNGKLDGECIIPDFEFERGTSKALFDNGIPIGIWKITYDGILTTEIDYTQGYGNQKVTFYVNGKVEETRQYKNNQLQ